MADLFELKFGEPLTKQQRTRALRNARIVKMHDVHGRGPEGATCGECAHLYNNHHSGRYWKCKFYGASNGPATDWRKRYAACGKFSKVEP